MTIPFVDAHIHLWDLDSTESDYSWVKVANDGLLGPLAEIQIPLWDAHRFAAESRHSKPHKVVHVQAAGAPGDPVAETIWLMRNRGEPALPDAIVARVELRGDDAGAVLDRHLDASSLVRGVRDMTSMGALDDPALPVGLAELASRGLSWELACTWEEMPAALRLANAQPDLAIVLGHLGFPLTRAEDYLESWRSALRQLAQAPNVHCKISGLGMGDHEWITDSWRPLVEHALEVFGPARCLVGTNWPVDRLYASYDAVVGALIELTSGLSDADRNAVLFANAERFYRI